MNRRAKLKILLTVLSIFLILLPLISSASNETIVYPLGEAIIEAINSGKQPTDASLLLLTKELKWYEENVSRLSPNIQNRIMDLRIKMAKQAVDKAASAIGDSSAMFGAIGSWNHGRDLDVIYFGKKTDRARTVIISSFESVTKDILKKGLQHDEILVKLNASGLSIPRSISAETLSFSMLELPDFGYGKMENAFKKVFDSIKKGESLEHIKKVLKDEFIDAMLSNFEAHIATTASGDFYRGASGQQWFKENYLQNPEKFRVFAIDEASGKVVLKRGGLEAVPEEVLQRLGFADFLKKAQRNHNFAKVASDMAMYWDHQKGGVGDTAKYYFRMWDDLDMDILSAFSSQEAMYVKVAKRIKDNPEKAVRILQEAGISPEEFNRQISSSMTKWTERLIERDTGAIVEELANMRFSPTSGSLVEQINTLKKTGRIKMDAMEIVTGLERLQKANPDFAKRLLNSLEKRFGDTEAGEIIIRYIKIQLKLLADEGGEITKRILNMLRKLNQISEADYQRALKAQSLQDMPPSVSSKLKRAKAEIMMIASANMATLDDSDELIDMLFSIWQKKYPQAVIKGRTAELLEFIDEIKGNNSVELKRLGWADEHLQIAERVKKRLQYEPQKMKALGYKMSEKMSRNGLSLKQLQANIYELLFSEQYKKFGDPSASVGALDTFMGVISGLAQSYDIIFNERYPNEGDENLALANAWVTAIPLVGDMAQGIITGIEGGFEGDKIKIAEAGLWISIGMLGFVPGGQIPALIAGLTLGLKPLAVATYNAYDAQNLIQAWVESAEWSKEQPPKIVAIFDRNGLRHPIKYEFLLSKKWGDVPYLSKRYGDANIGDSIRQYADQYIAPQYPGFKALRDALKGLYPDFDDKEWEDQFTADYKIDVRGAKAGKMVFKAYQRIRTKIYNDTIAHLKKWAEDEGRAATNYDAEVKRLRDRLKQLEARLGISNLLKNSDASVEAYSRIIINKFEQESLPLSKIRIYEHYVNAYEEIERKINRIKTIISEASTEGIPKRFFLTGYPEFDKDRIAKLLVMIEQGRKGIIEAIEAALREGGYDNRVFDINDPCHRKAFELLGAMRYKIAFQENLVEYYRQLIQTSSGWADAFELAKQRYIETRDLLNPLDYIAPTSPTFMALSNAVHAFLAALPYSLSVGDIRLYEETARNFELLMRENQREYNQIKAPYGAMSRLLEDCLKGRIKFMIEVSCKICQKDSVVNARAFILDGRLHKDMVWHWQSEGGLKKLKIEWDKADFIASGNGVITLTLFDWYNPNTRQFGKVIDVDRMEIKVEGDDCTYTYSDWTPCDPTTKKQTRRLISKEPKGCIEKEKPLLEQPCTTDNKEDERARLERERLERERQERERLERERKEAERKKLEEERKKEPPTCVYEYSDWGECSRATKKQTRTVIIKKPDGCIEKQRPSLEQGCTPPPTEEEKKNSLLNCICKCGSGIVGAHYHPEPVKGYSPSCDDLGNGPCMGGSWGCYRWFMPTGGECVKNCWEGVYGKGSYEQSRTDKIIKEENKKYAKPLTVKIKASKNPADFGDIVELTADTIGGTGGYKWSWGGCAQDAKDATAKVVNTRSCNTCTARVTVTDQDGNTASDSLLIQCNILRVKLIKESPKENKIPIGGKATFLAEVFSGDKPYSGPTLSYLWERNPDVIFGDPKNPQYEQKGGSQMRYSATFKKTGITPVWVVVRREIDGVWRTVGESEQIQIEVVNPELSIKATPEKPLVGQEVKLEVYTNPSMGDDLVSFWWDIPGYFSGTGNKATFKPKDTKPIKAVVHAKSKDTGEEIGTKEITITAQGYQVSISEPRYHGPKPRIWKCDTQLGGACPGLVEVADTQFAVFRDIFMKATVTPNPDSPRYRWSIDPAGSCGLPGAGSEIKINCSNTGTYTAKVEVTNADGVKLGEATQTVTVSISEEMLTASNKSKEAHEKLQKAKGLVNEGKLDEAINIANEASSLDPKNTEAKTLKDKWSKDREQINLHIDNINKFIKDKKFPEAEKELQGAKSLHPKYAKVIEAEKALNEAKQRHQKEVADKLNEAKRLAKEGKIDEAVSIVQEVAKIDKTTAQPVMNEISAEAKNKGWDALSKGDYKTAVKRLEQAVTLNPADTDAQNKLKGAKDYEAKMPLIESKMKEFERLIEEKKVVSSYQKLLEVQDILRTMALGQSSYNPVIIKYNEEYNKLNKWYNELIQKTNTEFTRLFNEQDWVKAEALLKDVLKYEHNEANKKNYESSLQMVQNNLRERKEAIQYYEQAKANNSKDQPSDIKGIEEVIRELTNKRGRFKPAEQEYKQMQELISEMEKRKKAISAVEYAKTTFMAGDQFYRAYQYGNAAVKYEEGLKAIRDNADTNSQLYVEYFTKWKDAVAKDSRYREIMNSLSNLLKNERLDEISIRNGIAMAEEGLKLVPNSAEIGGSLHRLKIKLSEIQKQKELETQKKAISDRLWDECSALAKQNRLNEALAKCKESLNYWSSDKRVAAVKDIEKAINQETQKKATADRLWDECSILAKQNKLYEALAKCNESLNYWSSDKRVAAVRDIEKAINQETQKKATADRLWDECSALAKQNRLNEALAKCKESLNYWSSDKRLAVVKDIDFKLKQPHTPPTKPPTTSDTVVDSRTSKSKGYWRLVDKKSETKKGSDCYPVDVLGDEGNIIVNMKSVCGENGIVRVRAAWTTPPERLIPNENLTVDAELIPELISGTNRGIDEGMEIKFDNADINCGYTTAGRIKIIEGLGAGVGKAGGKKTGEAKVPEKGRFKPDNLLKLSVCLRYYHQYYTYHWTEGTSGVGSSTNTMPTNIPGNTQVIFNNGNIGGVYNSPTRPTTFTINQPHVITLIQNYHWNNAKGSTPGTIGLRDQNGRTYGPWQAKGSPGQGGVPNAYWTVYPNITIPAGTYTVIDSEPSTWAQNSGSQGAGHTRIEGYPVESAGNQQTGGQSTSGNFNQTQRTITAEFKNASGNQNIHIFAEGQDSFGPHNRITPGATIKVNIKAPSQGGFIKFAAGRNGQVLATCKWDYDPDTISGRIPVVTFHEPNRLSCVTGIR